MHTWAALPEGGLELLTPRSLHLGRRGDVPGGKVQPVSRSRAPQLGGTEHQQGAMKPKTEPDATSRRGTGQPTLKPT